MWTDPIVEELHKNREEFAAQFNFDLHAMVKALQEREKTSKRKMISLDHASWIKNVDNSAMNFDELREFRGHQEFREHHT